MEMTDSVVSATEKSEDKKEIEDEEKERMLNEENKERGKEEGGGGGGDGEKGGEEEGKGDEKEGGGEQEAAAANKKDKGPISNVIGAIKVPSFLTRGRSRDGGKDGNPDAEEGKDLLEASSNPSSQAGASGSGGGLKAKLAVFEKIRLPKTFLKKNKDKGEGGGEKGNPGDATDGGAEEGKGGNEDEGEKKEGEGTEGGGEKIAATGEPDDGMETVKLESDVEKQDGDKESRKSLKEATGEWGKYEWRHRMITHVSKRRFIILCGLVLFVLLLIVIISIAASSGGGPHDHRGGASGDILHVEGRHVTAITSCGPVQGWLEDGAFAFRGIPYALPPVAALRWKPPVPLQRLEHCWNGTLVTHNATSPQPHACWQTFMNGSLDGYEDCLTVDVFAPRTKRNAPRVPVVVLIAAETLGGGGGKGSISPQLLSPQLARAAGVILVRVRFRLGALGFLSARALTQASSPPHSGNYGLADVRAALRWVNLNALAFGGDPRSITVLGHRAGATLVMALATSRKAHRLFSRAWLSGPASAFPPGGEAGQLDAEKRGQALVEALKCDNVSLADEGGSIASCLYQYDAEELLDSVPEEWKWRAVDLPSREEESDSLHRWLIVDGDVLNEPPLEAWASHSLEVPLVIGTLSHGESTRELRRRKDWSDLITVKQHIDESAVGEAKLTSEAMKLYSSPTFPPSSGSAPPQSPPPLARLTAMITDIRSICPLLNFTRSAAALANNVPLYFYTAASLPEESGAVGAVPESTDEPDMASALIGPGADLNAILTQPLHGNGGGLAKAISHMFYTYVRHGPTFNTTGSEMEELGAWPESKMPHRLMLIGQDGKVESVADYPRCEFWTKNGFVPRYARLD